MREAAAALAKVGVLQSVVSIFLFSTRTRRGAECGTGSNFCMEAPGRMPGPRGAGILPAACNTQVSWEDEGSGLKFGVKMLMKFDC